MSTVRTRIENRIAHLTVDRPLLNILDLETIAALGTELDVLASKADDLQLVILRGAGEKAFSAGVAVEDHTPDKVDALLDGFHAALRTLWNFPVPTMAVVQGHCLGGGMELASVCDLIVASEDSRFGQPEVRLGCFPPLAAALYPALLGSQQAFDLILTGRTIDAQEAHQMGFLARRPVHAGAVEDLVIEIVEDLSAHSGAVLRLTKKALRSGRENGFENFEKALTEAEAIYKKDLVATKDMHEGLDAFLEKRRPSWSHS